jgi:hypothetical protein
MGVHSNTRPQTGADAQATADVAKENAAIAASAKGQVNASANANAKPATNGANATAKAKGNGAAANTTVNAAGQLAAVPSANDRANNRAKGNNVSLPTNICGS